MSDVRSRLEKFVTLTQSRNGLMLGMVLFGVMTAVMARGWLADPQDVFCLFMGALFAGWSIEYAVKLTFPDGNQIGAANVGLLFCVLGCAYLYGR